MYFGPAKDARAYMVGLGYKDLPRQTSKLPLPLSFFDALNLPRFLLSLAADYLSGCTDPNERQFAVEDTAVRPSYDLPSRLRPV